MNESKCVNAVAAWVSTVDNDAVRATKDVNILVRRDDLTDINHALKPVGLMPVEVLGVAMFVDRKNPSPKAGVHLVFANERIRADYAHAAPDPGKAARAAAGFLVVDLLGLVIMKLQSNRDVDRTQVRDLLSVGLIDEVLERSLPKDMRTRLDQIKVTE